MSKPKRARSGVTPTSAGLAPADAPATVVSTDAPADAPATAVSTDAPADAPTTTVSTDAPADAPTTTVAVNAPTDRDVDAVDVLLAALGVDAADALAVNVEAGIVVTRDGKKHRLAA